MMLIILVLGVGMGWFARSVTRQKSAVAAIKSAGGTVTYNINRGNFIEPSAKLRAQIWIAERFGVDLVGRVTYVSLVPNRLSGKSVADDKTLAYLGQLDDLEFLSVNGTAVTDAGLAHIKDLKQLRNLEIGDTKVTDRGLLHLNGMTKLSLLYLNGSKVTDTGVLDLEVSLPRVQVIREDDQEWSSELPAAAKDLKYILSKPPRVACRLLDHRALELSYNSGKAEFIATINALCDLDANDPVSLEKLAASCSQCLGILDPSRTPFLTAVERRDLQNRCANRGVSALKKAIDLGYKNLRRLQSEDHRESSRLGNLHIHPGFPGLVETLKAKNPNR